MKQLLWAVIMMTGMWGFSSTRQPAVAGAFYPGGASSLRADVESMLEAGEKAAGEPALALVVPHAGYVYSGATAARGFSALPEDVERVILLGPSHYASFSGAALPDERLDAFATPLGEVELDGEALASLRGSKLFDGPAHAHDREHCLEVELPFLQVVAPGARIVPILIGQGTDRSMAKEIALELTHLLGDRTAVVVSTDFSHHGKGYGWSPFPNDASLPSTLVDLGRTTAERVADVDPRGFWQQVEVSGDTVCGKRPVGILTELLEHAFTGAGKVVEVTTSGHVSGSWDQSVTYVSVSFSGAWTEWREGAASAELGEISDGEGEAVVALARAALATRLTHEASLARWFSEHEVKGNLEAPAGAFVTLHNTGARARKEGRLRACMGVIEAREPLVDAVIHSAISASRDPRFPRLESWELDELEVEVSILSPTRRVSGPEAVEVGKHGVILSKAGRSAVFLPQVATEQGWDRETTLSHLARKAGLPGDAWQSGATFEVFTAQVFSEGE